MLVGACADVDLPTSQVAGQELVRECLDFPYVLDDVNWARQHGYGTELDRNCRAETRIDRVRADPRFAEALRPWADCMRANGYPYPSPAAVRAALPLANGQETRLASTEAECALTSGLATTAKALDREY